MSPLGLPVEEFTSPNLVTAKVNTPIRELQELMRVNEVRHLPILRGDDIVGIISDRDLKLVLSLDDWQRSQLIASDIMIEDPITVDAGTSIEEVAFEMSKRKIGSVIVTDQNEIQGIFTVTDALNALIEIARGN